MKAARRKLKLGDIVNGNKVVGMTTTNGIISVYLMPMAAYPKFKFHVEIKKQEDIKYRVLKPQYWAILVSTNGKIAFDGETRKSKTSLIKTINNLFPGVKIVDKTKG
jgi:uncharacterized protein YegP (UPF0339 family)